MNLTHPFARHLPNDIAASTPPMIGVSSGPGNWGSVPLVTDVYSGVTPVGLHLSDWGGQGKKWHLQNDWRSFWFEPHAQSLLDAATRTTVRTQPTHGVAYEWVSGGGKLYTDSGEALEFREACADVWDLLLADGTEF